MIITEDNLLCSHLHTGHSSSFFLKSILTCAGYSYKKARHLNLYVSLITLEVKNVMISLDDYPKKSTSHSFFYLKLKQLIFLTFLPTLGLTEPH